MFLCKISTMSFFTRFFHLRPLCSSTEKNAELKIRKLLLNRFPQQVFDRTISGDIGGQAVCMFNKYSYIMNLKQANVTVNDVSGGCGAMFEVFVETPEFKGMNTLKQHKLVTNTLKEQIKEMHGVRIHTSIPDKI